MLPPAKIKFFIVYLRLGEKSESDEIKVKADEMILKINTLYDRNKCSQIFTFNCHKHKYMIWIRIRSVFYMFFRFVRSLWPQEKNC